MALGCTVAELNDRMSKEEFEEWMAYYNIEPWGSVIDGYRSASIASVAANTMLGVVNPKKLTTRPYKLKDFLVGVKQSIAKKRTVSDIKKTLMSLVKKGRDK